MRIFNADGSEARMCGNASRCIGKYLFDYGLTSKTEIALDTLSGIRMLNLHLADGKVRSVTVDRRLPTNQADCDGKRQTDEEQPIEVDGGAICRDYRIHETRNLVILSMILKPSTLQSSVPNWRITLSSPDASM